MLGGFLSLKLSYMGSKVSLDSIKRWSESVDFVPLPSSGSRLASRERK